MQTRMSRLFVAVALLASGSLQAGELVGHAFVQDDGSLLIKERVVHLFGVYIPETDRQCREWLSPVRCDERAVLKLDAIVRGFVRCDPQRERADGSLEAICFIERTSFEPGTDLGAYLIEKGWALARPGAPFEYHAKERIARSQGRGVWGFTIDSIEQPGRD